MQTSRCPRDQLVRRGPRFFVTDESIRTRCEDRPSRSGAVIRGDFMAVGLRNRRCLDLGLLDSPSYEACILSTDDSVRPQAWERARVRNRGSGSSFKRPPEIGDPELCFRKRPSCRVPTGVCGRPSAVSGERGARARGVWPPRQASCRVTLSGSKQRWPFARRRRRAGHPPGRRADRQSRLEEAAVRCGGCWRSCIAHVLLDVLLLMSPLLHGALP